ncbi:MAG: PAS domain-containing protein, partial [Verrucomicrobia bacterium]|nr:PAS domain-containing protein [Prolixibacteraceae bacterium]
MKKEKEQLPVTDLLRKKAEEKLNRMDSGNRQILSEIDSIKLLHELEVHQIELEMQLEELKVARNKAEFANERFTNLYDFAPAGYFTIDRDSRISELNLSGAHMLGMERSFLINKKFSQFITRDSLPVFNDFLFKVFEPNPKATCYIVLNIPGNPTTYLHLEGMIFDDENKCQITAIDISENKRSENLVRFSEMRY